jgi:perosamine synthetase
MESELFSPLPKWIKVPFSKPYWNIFQIKKLYISKNLDAKLFQALKTHIPEKKATLVDSATTGIYLILKELNLKANDEVIIPSYVCKAVIKAVLASGCKPIFADIQPDFNLSLQSIQQNTSSKTKAIIAVHQYGKISEIEKIQAFCRQKNIVLIEDAAIPFGMKHKNKPLGSFGDYSVFSFNMGKTIVSFGGGLVLSKKEFDIKKKPKTQYLSFLTDIYYKPFFTPLYHFLRLLRLVNREENIRLLYQKTDKGKPEVVPATMTRLQKATTLYQLIHMHTILANQQKIAETYMHQLQKIPQIQLPSKENQVWTYFPIRVKDRYPLSKYLSKQGIETQWTFFPLHLQSKYAQFKKNNLTNTDQFWTEELSLPIGPRMSEKKALYVSEKIKAYYEKN